MPFGERLAARVREVGNPACVGLDPHPGRVPGWEPEASNEEAAAAVLRFSIQVIEAVAPLVPAIKPQVAFYESLGARGVRVLEQVVAAAREAGLVTVLDAKRGDIGSTANAYARATIDPNGPMGADAVTLSPYLGPESLAPYLRHADQGRGLFVLVRTSNEGAGPWQVDTGVAERVAAWVAEQCPGPGFGAVGAVVAGTLPQGEAARWRAAMPRSWFLVPGFGAQGAGPADVRDHFLPDGTGALITSSREVLFPKHGVDDRVVDGVRARARALVDAVRSLPG